jgi:hypothetical protein
MSTLGPGRKLPTVEGEVDGGRYILRVHEDGVYLYYLLVFWDSLVSGWGKHGPPPSFLPFLMFM